MFRRECNDEAYRHGDEHSGAHLCGFSDGGSGQEVHRPLHRSLECGLRPVGVQHTCTCLHSRTSSQC